MARHYQALFSWSCASQYAAGSDVFSLLSKKLWLFCRFVLPPYLTLKNFEGLNIGKMDQVSVTSEFIADHAFLPGFSRSNARASLCH
jgi:hypothetical protein